MGLLAFGDDSLGTDDADLLAEGATGAQIDAAFSGSTTPPAIGHAKLDGLPWTVERGSGGDLLMAYGTRARFHLDAAATRLLCAPADPASLDWQRVLMDSALVTASLQRGNEALHAGAVVIEGQAIAIAGQSGAGKSTLLAALRGRGRLLTDDVLVLTAAPGAIVAHPGPPLLNAPSRVALQPGDEVLGEFGDERWVRAGAWCTESVPLGAIYLLDRHEGATPGVFEVKDPAGALLAIGLDSGSAAQRRIARLDLLAGVAARVPVRRVVAALDTEPAAVAAMIGD